VFKGSLKVDTISDDISNKNKKNHEPSLGLKFLEYCKISRIYALVYNTQADFSLLLTGKIRVHMHNTDPASGERHQMLALQILDCYIENS